MDEQSNPAPSPPPPLRLFNVFAKTPETIEKCYYTIPTSLHTYFYRKLFPGERGIYQNLISPFISKLYVECQRRGLRDERAIWDKSNEGIVAEILRDLNFDNTTHLADSITVLQAELDTLRAQLRPPVPVAKRGASKRRTAPSPNVPPRQP